MIRMSAYMSQYIERRCPFSCVEKIKRLWVVENPKNYLVLHSGIIQLMSKLASACDQSTEGALSVQSGMKPKPATNRL